jgi:hypothetical protein
MIQRKPESTTRKPMFFKEVLMQPKDKVSDGGTERWDNPAVPGELTAPAAVR